MLSDSGLSASLGKLGQFHIGRPYGKRMSRVSSSYGMIEV